MLALNGDSPLIWLGQFIIFGTMVYAWVIIFRVILTWINPNPSSSLMRILSQLTDPVLNLGRRYIPLTLGGIDFSPIVVIIVIQLLGSVLGEWLVALGQGQTAFILVPLVVLALLRFVSSIVWMLIVLMIIRLIMALVNPSPYNFLVQVVYGLTEPLLAPLRRLLPPGPKGMDLRPLLFLGVIILIQQVVLGALIASSLVWLTQF